MQAPPEILAAREYKTMSGKLMRHQVNLRITRSKICKTHGLLELILAQHP